MTCSVYIAAVQGGACSPVMVIRAVVDKEITADRCFREFLFGFGGELDLHDESFESRSRNTSPADLVRDCPAS